MGTTLVVASAKAGEGTSERLGRQGCHLIEVANMGGSGFDP